MEQIILFHPNLLPIFQFPPKLLIITIYPLIRQNCTPSTLSKLG